jgi:VIT1/CCC1 family predicted Fe2+/Mn2+ transporter
MVPLISFFLAKGSLALQISILFTAICLFLVGAILSLFTGRGALRGGIRMLLIGGMAGAATFLIGKMLGVSLS